MKRYRVPTLEIVIELNETANIAASKVTHLTSVDPTYLLTDEQLQVINDIVESAISNILDYNFKILSEYHSKKSYAYYIKFRPFSSEGEALPEFKMIFRVAEHNQKPERVGKGGGLTLIKSFIVNNEVFSNPVLLMQKIRNTCDEISHGDYSSLI